jgi:hypothetical protein
MEEYRLSKYNNFLKRKNFKVQDFKLNKLNIHF